MVAAAVVVLAGAAHGEEAEGIGRLPEPDTSQRYQGPQLTDGTAYTVPQGQHKLGLFTVEYGVSDDVQLKIYTPAWGILAPNAALEWRFVNDGVISASASAEAMYLSSRIIREVWSELPVFDVVIVPLELALSVTPDPSLAFTAAAHSNLLSVSGNFGEDLFAGAAAVTSLDVHGTVEWRFHQRAALLVRARYLIAQGTAARANVVVRPDEFTTIEARAAAESDVLDFADAYQITLGTLVSWNNFNLRLGVGYGNFIIPIVGLWTPSRNIVPDVDLYWRF